MPVFAPKKKKKKARPGQQQQAGRHAYYNSSSSDSDSDTDTDANGIKPRGYKALDIQHGLSITETFPFACFELETIVAKHMHLFNKAGVMALVEDVMYAIEHLPSHQQSESALKKLVDAIGAPSAAGFKQSQVQNIQRAYKAKMIQMSRSQQQRQKQAPSDSEEEEEASADSFSRIKFDDLPIECLENIIKHLDPISLVNLAATTRAVALVYKSDNEYWGLHYLLLETPQTRIQRMLNRDMNAATGIAPGQHGPNEYWGKFCESAKRHPNRPFIFYRCCRLLRDNQPVWISGQERQDLLDEAMANFWGQARDTFLIYFKSTKTVVKSLYGPRDRPTRLILRRFNIITDSSDEDDSSDDDDADDEITTRMHVWRCIGSIYR